MTVKGSTDNVVFHSYVTEILVPQLWQGAIVVMHQYRSAFGVLSSGMDARDARDARDKGKERSL